MTYQISALYASILAIIYLFLCYKVVYSRRTQKIEIGDGGDTKLLRYLRAQANAAEYIPIALILLFIAEANGLSTWLLHSIGISFVIARLIHPVGFINKRGISFGRFYGTLITWIVILSLSIINLLMVFKII